LDFGLAKLAKLQTAPDGSATLDAAQQETSPGMVLGTVGYMSPEQVRGETADARSDIFALGTILYEMLSGQRAFRRDTSAETMTAILKEEPPEITTSGTPIAPAIERIVRRCLEKKPQQRFQSARDLAFDLEGLSGHTGTSGTHVASLPAEPTSGPLRRKRLIPIAAGLLVLLAGLAGWLLRGTGTTTLPSYNQLTFERGLVYAARFAPDGQSVYYGAAWNGQPVQIYSTTPGSPESRPLNLIDSTLFAVTSSELAVSLGCKDQYIGDCQGTLATVPVSGGSPREVTDAVLSADWTTGGEMAVVRHVQEKFRVEFPREKVIFEGERALGYVRISPNGKYIAFAEFHYQSGDVGWVVVLDRSGKEIIRSPAFVSLEGLAWSPSGEEVWFGGTQDTGWANAIHALRLNGKQRIVLRLPGMLRLHDVSRDGRILLTKESWRSEMQFRGPGDAEERNLSWLDYAQLESLSPDGKRVAFQDWGAASGSSPLSYVRNTDGSPAIKLGQWIRPILSPDGKQVLAIDGLTPGQSRLSVLPIGIGESRPLESSGFQQLESWGWMPDGNGVYYSGDDGHGWRTYVQDIKGGGAPRAVTPPISVMLVRSETDMVSPDGKFVFARDLSGKGELYPIAGGESKTVPGFLPEDEWVTWSSDGRSAYVSHNEKTSAPLYRLDLTTGKRELVATLGVSDPAGVTAIFVQLTPDGKAYAYSYLRELSDLFIVENVR
jgi:hypothetical protein